MPRKIPCLVEYGYENTLKEISNILTPTLKEKVDAEPKFGRYKFAFYFYNEKTEDLVTLGNNVLIVTLKYLEVLN